MGQSGPAGLFAEGDLASRRQILDVHTIGEVGLVPFDLGQDRFAPKGMKGRHFATGERSVSGVLTGTLKKSLAVADDIADLDRL